MHTLIRTRYPSVLSEARRASALKFKEALALLDTDAPLESVLALRDGDIESAHGHSLTYVTWVLETAQLASGGVSAREFAKTFLERPFDFSTTKAGIAALKLEVWLARRGQALFRKFVETVVDKSDTFLLVFEGELSETELDRMKLQTEEFVQDYTPLVVAGQRNKDNMVSDLTIFEVTAAKKLTKDDLPEEPKASVTKMPEPRDDERKRESGLRPESREDYDQIIREGGLSTAAIPVVFGMARVMESTKVSTDGLAFVDPNGVRWARARDEDRWTPTFAEPVQEAGGPPGLRKAAKGSWQSCADCAYYDHPANGKSGQCSQFGVAVATNQICDAWDGRETGAESVSPTIRIVVSEDRQEPEVATSQDGTPPYEVTEAGVRRSLCGSWAVFEAPVADGTPLTVIVAETAAWALDVPLDRVLQTVDQLAECYPDSEVWHRDRCIEHALAEWARDVGSEVENLDECVAIAQADPDMLAERDETIAETLTEAPKEKPEPKAKEKPKDEKPEPKAKEKGAKPAFGKEGDGPPAPPAPPEPPEPSDRMDEPEFYRDDLQTYYDVQLLAGVPPKKAEQKTRLRFAVKELVVTPTGEVRSPGVTDRPKPPPPPMPGAEPGVPPAPIEQPDGAPDQASAGAPPPAKEGVDEVAAVVASWAKRTGKSQEEAERLWKKAGDLASQNYPDLEAESDRWYQVKMGIYRRMMGVAAEARLAEPETIDDAFHRWVRLADGDVIDFEEWLADNHPKFLPHLSVWIPADLHEGREAPPTLTADQDERYAKWRRLLNMTPNEIRVMDRRVGEATMSLSVTGLRAFSLGRKSTRRLLAMKSRPATSWTEDDWQWAARQINTVSKLRSTPGPLLQDGKPTEKLLLLRAWGHEPRVRSQVSEAAVLVNQRVGWRCRSCHALVTEASVRYDTADESWLHSCGKKLIVPPADEEARRQINRRVIDTTPGSLPCLIGDSAPSFSDLKAGRVDLSDDERTEVMRKKAVWHPGNLKGKAVPAVWKSIVDGKTFYVTNTHRAYNVAPSVKGAIGRYHAFIKSTA